MRQEKTLTFLQQQFHNFRITFPGSSVQSSVPEFILKYPGGYYFIKTMYNNGGTIHMEQAKKKNLAVTSFRETDSLHQKQSAPPDELNPSVANEIN